jgi:hypothetical protein
MAIRAGLTAYFTAEAFNFVGTATLGVGHRVPEFLSPAHLANIAGHALVGCASAVAQGGRCGPGALSAAAGSFAGPILKDLKFERNLVAHAVIGGLASVAGGGNFANGAVTAAFGYLFNQAGGDMRRMLGGNLAEYGPVLAAQAKVAEVCAAVSGCGATTLPEYTFYGGVGGEASFEDGSHFSFGLLGVFSNEPDLGGWASGGNAKGVGAGVGAFLGWNWGNAKDFQNYDTQYNYNTPLGGLTLNYTLGQWTGMQINTPGVGITKYDVNTRFCTVKQGCQ